MSDERWEVVCADGSARWKDLPTKRAARKAAKACDRDEWCSCGPHTVRKVTQ